MPDNLSIYEQRQAQQENQDLGQAMHAADWTSTFHQPNSVENLRAQRNVTDLVAQALQRKQDLAMATDENAAKIYQINQASRIAAEQAPLRDQVLRGQIANEAAGNAYKATVEAATLHDKAGFLNDLTNISRQYPVNTQQHADAVAAAFANHPYAAADKESVDTYLSHTKVADRARQLAEARDAYKSTFGTDPGFVEMTATGGVNLHGKPGEAVDPLRNSDYADHAKASADVALHNIAAENEKAANIKANKPNMPYSKSREMAVSQELKDRLEARFPQLKQKQESKHLGTYNPATGNFE